jgi:hypothetical protein
LVVGLGSLPSGLALGAATFRHSAFAAVVVAAGAVVDGFALPAFVAVFLSLPPHPAAASAATSANAVSTGRGRTAGKDNPV